MYTLQNACKNILRNVVRGVMTGAVIAAAIAVISAALSIDFSAKDTLSRYKDQFGRQVSISPDIEKLMELSDPYAPPISADQYRLFAQSEYIESYVLSGSQGCTSDALNVAERAAYDRSTIVMSGAVSAYTVSMRYAGPEITLIGASPDDFDSGSRQIKEGRPAQNDGECVVSEKFAELNDLAIGDAVALHSQAYSAEGDGAREIARELTVVGVWGDAADLAETTIPMRASGNRQNEIFTTLDTLLASLEPGEYGVQVSAQYMLKDPKDLDALETEMRAKGLDGLYKLGIDEAGYKRIAIRFEGLRGSAAIYGLAALVLGAGISVLISSVAIRKRKSEIAALRAMGMKKSAVAAGLWIEMLLVACICATAGLCIGAAIAQPAADVLLAGQLNRGAAVEAQNAAYGRTTAFLSAGEYSQSQPLEKLEVSFDARAIALSALAAGILASAAALAAVARGLRFAREPFLAAPVQGAADSERFESGRMYAIVRSPGEPNRSSAPVNREAFQARNAQVIDSGYGLIGNATALENTLLPSRLGNRESKPKKAYALDLLEKVGIDKTQARQKVCKLPVGYRQRVKIARALCAQPKRILAVEPGGGLDRQTEDELLRILSRAAREDGKCVIVVTDSRRATEYADEIWSIKDGRLLFIKESQGN